MRVTNGVGAATAAASCVLALMLIPAPAFAVAEVEQCRFIQAKPEREACYNRQAAALAVRRKPEPVGSTTTTLDSLREMRQEDDAVYRSMHNICRGC